VRGVDLLGQPFEERTATLAFNQHGCRYTSKHHLPRNSWVTLEIRAGSIPAYPLRARVAWVQRPHSIRDFFQIAVELETPANVWKHEATPGSEAVAGGLPALTPGLANFMNHAMSESRAEASSREIVSDLTVGGGEAPGFEPTQYSPLRLASDSPLIRELRTQLDAQAKEAAAGVAEEVRREVQQARELVGHLNHQTEALRSAGETAHERNIQLTQSLSRLEAAEAAPAAGPTPGQTKEELEARESLAKGWRRRLDSEMQEAQKQWNELLQSSLDSSLHHMVEQIAGHSQEILQNAEKKMTARLGELREPFAKAAEEARDTIAGIQSSLDREVQRARGSLTEVEQVAGRTKEISEQLEAASHDTLNQLHRRLEKILDTHTAEMNRRAEGISANLSQRVGLSLDSAGHQFLERTIAETEGRLAPHLERVPALLRELEAREVQTEEGLRVHRERLRQLAEGNYREVETQIATTSAKLHADFEAARRDALGKWSEELDASGVRAAHAAAEALGRTSEWFQQEARARLQVLVEQAVVTAGVGLNEKSAAATQSFESQLAVQAATHLAQIREQVEAVGSEAAGRARTELDRAAEAAAASFGQVLHSESERQTLEFRATTSGIQRERAQQFDHTTQELLHKLDVNAWSSIESFRARMTEHLDAAVVEGRGALHVEFASALESYRAEREAHKQQWIEHLENLSGEASGKYQDKLQSASEAWVLSSMRRLNEHGQNGIETLLRTADQALRDSFAKVFEGLSEMLRDRAAGTAGVGNVSGFGQLPNRDSSDSAGPRNKVI
jgi:hypothetical protein